MRIAMAQINPIVGDLENNTEKVRKYTEKAEGRADLIVFPELSITGYPPQDLLFEDRFVRKNRKLLMNIIGEFDIAGII